MAPSSTSQATNLVLPWRWRLKQQGGGSRIPIGHFLEGCRELSALCHRLHWQLQLNRHRLDTDRLSSQVQYKIDMHLSSYLSSFCPHISNGIVSCSRVCIPFSQLTQSVDPLDLFPFLFITGDLNVKWKSTMKCVVRSDLTTKIIQQRHFLGLHLQPS